MRKKNTILRVGFDLDGVLLYNPARIVRPLIAWYKSMFLKKKKLSFYYPRSPLEKQLWRLFHKSSIFLAPGISEIDRLVKEKKIEAYIVTARYNYMGEELMKWIKHQNLNLIFKEIHFNKMDEQPHLYKERKIKELKLDVFIEDNWDIINYLYTKLHITSFTDKNAKNKSQKKVKLFWVYNLFDRGIDYPYKFPGFREGLRTIIQNSK